MQENSLRIAQNDNFLNRLGKTLTRLLIPTKLGINGMVISIKRNSLIKAFNNYIESDTEEDVDKKEYIEKKYENVYTAYLESIDKNVMDTIYKKVKNDNAN